MHEDAETAEWRARCTAEMCRLRHALQYERDTIMALWDELVTDYPSFCTSRQSTKDEIVLCFPASGNTITVYVLRGYPCLAAHLNYYGDQELIRLREATDDTLATLGYDTTVHREWLLALLDMEVTPPPPEHR